MFGAGGFIGLQLEKFENEKRDALQSMLMETNKFGLPRVAQKKWQKKMTNKYYIYIRLL